MLPYAELLLNGTRPQLWEPWAALGALCVTTLAALALLRAVARSGRRGSPTLPRGIRIGVPMAFVVLLLLCYAPLLQHVLLLATGITESYPVLDATKRRRRVHVGPWARAITVTRCEVEVRAPRGEIWNATLIEDACNRWRLRHEAIAVPFVVSRALRVVRQPGYYPHVDFAWLVYASIGALTFALIALATRASRRASMSTWIAYRLRGASPRSQRGADAGSGAGAGSASAERLEIHPRTLALARERWSRVMYDHRFDAQLPAGAQYARAVLFHDARVGESTDIAFFPIGADGNADPNRARCFWVRRTGNDRADHGPDEPVAGPIKLG
jgi:hypothetical protein